MTINPISSCFAPLAAPQTDSTDSRDPYLTPPSSPRSKTILKLTPERVQVLTRPLSEKCDENRYLKEASYEAIRAQLKSLVRGDEQGVSLEAIEELRQKIASYHLTSVKDRILLLKLLSEKPFCGIELIFYETLQELRLQLPQLQHYMCNELGLRDHEGPLLTPLGIKKIIDFFNEEYEFPSDLLSSISASQLPFVVQKLIDSKEEGKIMGYVVSSDSFHRDRHIVPVFCIYFHDAVYVYITDSEGHDFLSEKKFMSKSLVELVDHPDTYNLIQQGRLKIHSYKEKRQHGHVECSVFSLLDLKSLIEMHLRQGKNIVQYYEQQIELFKPKEIHVEVGMQKKSAVVYELSILPSAMMKPTQSLKKFRQLKEEYSESWVPYEVTRLNSRGEVIKKVVDAKELYNQVEFFKSTTAEGKQQNLYVLKKRFDSIIYLIVQILENPDSLPTPALTAQPWRPKRREPSTPL